MEIATITLTSSLAHDLDEAFPDLVRSKQNAIYSGVFRVVGHREDAADITQETFIRAYAALGGYDQDRINELRLDGWLWTIALNLCRNRGRRRPPVPSEIPDQASEAIGPESAVVVESETAIWGARLRRLSGPQRTAVVLRHVIGLSYEEISAATDRPIGTVKADAHRGVKRLRTILEAEAMR